VCLYLCLYVCICVYVCVVFVCIFVCFCVCALCICVYVFVCFCVVYMCVFVCVVCMLMCFCTFLCIYVSVCCHIRSPFSSSRIIIVSLGILTYTTGPPSTGASFASLSTNSFPSISTCTLTQPKCTIHFKRDSVIMLFLINSINRFRVNVFCSKCRVILLSVYTATRLSLSCPS